MIDDYKNFFEQIQKSEFKIINKNENQIINEVSFISDSFFIPVDLKIFDEIFKLP